MTWLLSALGAGGTPRHSSQGRCGTSMQRCGIASLAVPAPPRGLYRDALRPDLVLLDLNLPSRDGREVLADLLRSRRRLATQLPAARQRLHHQTRRLRSVRRRDPQDRQLFLACGAATRPPSHTQHALSPSGRRRVEVTATLAFRLVERGGGRDEANQAAAWAEVTAIAATRTPFLPAASRSVTGSPVVRGTDHSGHELTRTAPSDCNRITINPHPPSCLGTPPPRY